MASSLGHKLVLQKKLVPSIIALNTRVAQESKKLKDPGEGRPLTGLPAAHTKDAANE